MCYNDDHWKKHTHTYEFFAQNAPKNSYGYGWGIKTTTECFNFRTYPQKFGKLPKSELSDLMSLMAEITYFESPVRPSPPNSKMWHYRAHACLYLWLTLEHLAVIFTSQPFRAYFWVRFGKNSMRAFLFQWQPRFCFSFRRYSWQKGFQKSKLLLTARQSSTFVTQYDPLTRQRVSEVHPARLFSSLCRATQCWHIPQDAWNKTAHSKPKRKYGLVSLWKITTIRLYSGGATWTLRNSESDYISLLHMHTDVRSYAKLLERRMWVRTAANLGTNKIFDFCQASDALFQHQKRT